MSHMLQRCLSERDELSAACRRLEEHLNQSVVQEIPAVYARQWARLKEAIQQDYRNSFGWGPSKLGSVLDLKESAKPIVIGETCTLCFVRSRVTDELRWLLRIPQPGKCRELVVEITNRVMGLPRQDSCGNLFVIYLSHNKLVMEMTFLLENGREALV